MERADIVVVGAGAAGLMAAIQAARAAPRARVLTLDGAGRLGAKILIAGGGRCNVTHRVVTPDDYAGSSRPAIRKVLGRFGVAEVRAFFAELGVELKEEETGKLFPTTNRARTVLEALLEAATEAGVEVLHPWRVHEIQPEGSALAIRSEDQTCLLARRVVLATGGRSVAQTGSDGHGYVVARTLGHSTTPLLLPALVPLTLPSGHPLTTLRGLSATVRIAVHASGREQAAFQDSLLLTHFGVSGPAVLDISRYYLSAKEGDSTASLAVDWLPSISAPDLDASLQRLGTAPLASAFTPHLPRRLAETLVEQAGLPGETTGDHLRRDQRRGLVDRLKAYPLPVVGARGWDYAEVTAGGVPLAEVDLATMASRKRAGLHLCGEILDVDGRIGGFNFQWAWASGTLAGRGATQGLPSAQ